MAVDATLFLFAGKVRADHERNFGAIQADAFRAAVERGGDIGQESGIGIERDVRAVGGHRRLVAQLRKASGQLRFFAFQAGEFRRAGRRRVG